MDSIEWDLFRELSTMRDQMDRLVGSFFRGNRLSGDARVRAVPISRFHGGVKPAAVRVCVVTARNQSRWRWCGDTTRAGKIT